MSINASINSQEYHASVESTINLLHFDFSNLSDKAVLHQTSLLRKQDVLGTAKLIAYLCEIIARKAFVREGYSNFHAYATQSLGFSEGEAFVRSQVANKARKVPALYESLAKNEISLTVAALLAPHLTSENAGGLLTACRGFSKKKAEEVLAGFAGKPQFKDSIRAAAANTKTPETIPSPVKRPSLFDVSQNPEDSLPDRSSDRKIPASPEAPELKPEVAASFNVRFSMSRECKEKLDRLGELLGKGSITGHVEEIISYALDAALDKVDPKRREERRRKKHLAREKRKLEAKEKKSQSHKSRPAEVKPNPRYISPKLRDEVLARAGYQCEFTSLSGQRCTCKTHLELDHTLPLSFGGKTVKDNLRVMCAIHHLDKTRAEFG